MKPTTESEEQRESFLRCPFCQRNVLYQPWPRSKGFGSGLGRKSKYFSFLLEILLDGICEAEKKPMPFPHRKPQKVTEGLVVIFRIILHVSFVEFNLREKINSSAGCLDLNEGLKRSPLLTKLPIQYLYHCSSPIARFKHHATQ
jgi:hypothetical protein